MLTCSLSGCLHGVLQAALEAQLMRSDVERMMKEEMVGAGMVFC